MPDQFSNLAVVEAHRCTNAREILERTGGSLRVLMAGVGTGGTITGVGGVQREEAPEVLVVAVEPAASPFLSAGWSGPHHIVGLGASFLPPNLDRHLIDRVMTVSDTEVFRGMGLLARKEGLLMGPSSGACVQAALRLAEELGLGHRVVTILADRSDCYVDSPL